jgi:hypothetical protein
MPHPHSFSFLPVLTLMALAGLHSMPCASAQETGDTNEGIEKISPRFEVREREWPKQFGEASLCLWKHDALAALSITVDDNSGPDHTWWLEMGDTHGLKVTWFIITSAIGNSFSGPWENYRNLVARGHDVQSHSVTAMHPDRPGWKDVESEFSDSQKAIEANIPGVRCLTFAYPGGGDERTVKSKSELTALAAKYYIGARGRPGINAANTIHYHRVSSISGRINYGDAKHAVMDMKHCLEKSGSPRLASLYRGWYVCHFHLLKPADKETLQKPFALVAEKVKSGELWMGLFREVCLYAQERDTAQLTVEAVKPEKITFVLTDKVDDARFDFPLTVKIRLDESWKSVKATQANKEQTTRLVTHEGSVFALVEVVPDRGNVVLEKTSP